jgi:hypothetical protein
VVVGAPFKANTDGSSGAIFVYKTESSKMGLMAGKRHLYLQSRKL